VCHLPLGSPRFCCSGLVRAYEFSFKSFRSRRPAYRSYLAFFPIAIEQFESLRLRSGDLLSYAALKGRHHGPQPSCMSHTCTARQIRLGFQAGVSGGKANVDVPASEAIIARAHPGTTSGYGDVRTAHGVDSFIANSPVPVDAETSSAMRVPSGESRGISRYGRGGALMGSSGAWRWSPIPATAVGVVGAPALPGT